MKVCTVATNFLKFCRTGSVNGVAFPVGASGVGYASGVGKMYTWSVVGVVGRKWIQKKLLGLFHCFFSTALLSYKGKDFFFLLPWKNNSTHI